ncbi:MAG TPA: cyanophycin synthetase, partial [Candidatus Limnocylindrales bacterium]
YTASLEAEGIRLAWAHDPSHVEREPAPQRLGVTKALTAIAPDHPELEAARRAGIPIEPWQQVIADAAFDRTLVGVAGTHGKSTTAGWLVHLLASAGADPSAFVGALLSAEVTGGVPATARRGGGAAFVVEADEYAGNFDAYRPSHAVVTNLEWDHPDVFADRAAVVGAVEAWLRRAGEGHGAPVVYANVADEGAAALVERLTGTWPGSIVGTALIEAGTGEDRRPRTGRAILGRIVATDAESTTIELSGDGLPTPVRARLALVGRHNAANALGAAAAALGLGVPPDAVASGLSSFRGVGRRLERKGEAQGVVVFDDYGHHPTAIRETLRAVRQRAPGRRIWAVYEPLTFHRTAALVDAFADVLSTADGVAIADIWAGRDRDTTVASAAGLAEAVAKRNPGIPVAAPGSVEETARWLAVEVRPGDAVLVMGGGRSYRIAELLLEALADR